MPFGPSDFWHSEVSTCADTSLQLLRAPLRATGRGAHAVARGARHEPPRESDLHRQGPHHRRPCRRFAQRRWAPRGQAVEARHAGRRHQPGAAVRGRLVGLLRVGDGAGGAPNEDRATGRSGGRRTPTMSRCVSISACQASSRMSARRLVDATHHVCPYSRATHGNIAVETKLV
jgi:hypothetical protein